MKVQFLTTQTFDYGDGEVTHEAGDKIAVHEGGPPVRIDVEKGEVSLRKDKAQRWVTRNAAAFVEEAKTETKEYSDGSSATGTAPLPDKSPAQQDAEKVDDNAVESPKDVARADGGDSGKRPVDEPASSKPAPKGKTDKKPAGRRHK